MSQYIKKPKKTFKTKPCQCCGRQFEYEYDKTNSRYCSKECSREALLEVRRRWLKNNRQRIKAGALRSIGTHQNCKLCGTEFVRKVQNESYCSDQCRKKRKSFQKAASYEQYMVNNIKRNAEVIRLKAEAVLAKPVLSARTEAKFDVDRALKRVGLA
jgi:hypothetical protein